MLIISKGEQVYEANCRALLSWNWKDWNYGCCAGGREREGRGRKDEIDSDCNGDVEYRRVSLRRTRSHSQEIKRTKSNECADWECKEGGERRGRERDDPSPYSNTSSSIVYYSITSKMQSMTMRYCILPYTEVITNLLQTAQFCAEYDALTKWIFPLSLSPTSHLIVICPNSEWEKAWNSTMSWVYKRTKRKQNTISTWIGNLTDLSSNYDIGKTFTKRVPLNIYRTVTPSNKQVKLKLGSIATNDSYTCFELNWHFKLTFLYFLKISRANIPQWTDENW